MVINWNLALYLFAKHIQVSKKSMTKNVDDNGWTINEQRQRLINPLKTLTRFINNYNDVIKYIT